MRPAFAWIGSNTGLLLAILGIVVAWWIYRSQQSAARRGVLDGLTAELSLHASWVGHSYRFEEWPSADTWWSKEELAKLAPVPLVNRLSTVAIDAAIAQGPSLFINPQLVFALVQYRQRAEQLNQLIDNATGVQQSPDLWLKTPNSELMEHFAQVTAWIHWIGIGTLNDRINRDGAHRHFVAAALQLERERSAGLWSRFAWFSYGRTWARASLPARVQIGDQVQPKGTDKPLDDQRLG